MRHGILAPMALLPWLWRVVADALTTTPITTTLSTALFEIANQVVKLARLAQRTESAPPPTARAQQLKQPVPPSDQAPVSAHRSWTVSYCDGQW